MLEDLFCKNSYFFTSLKKQFSSGESIFGSKISFTDFGYIFQIFYVNQFVPHFASDRQKLVPTDFWKMVTQEDWTPNENPFGHGCVAEGVQNVVRGERGKPIGGSLNLV
jgi:hypothetical protein